MSRQFDTLVYRSMAVLISAISAMRKASEADLRVRHLKQKAAQR